MCTIVYCDLYTIVYCCVPLCTGVYHAWHTVVFGWSRDLNPHPTPPHPHPTPSQDARATAELLEILRSGDLPAAAATCLAAAAAELDPHKQAALLRASCYGRAFCALDPASGGLVGAGDAASRREPAEVARRLRLLNSLYNPGRSHTAGR